MNIQDFCKELGGTNFKVNYKLLEESDDYKLYFLYTNEEFKGCFGRPTFAIETKKECRVCSNLEYHKFFPKYKTVINSVIRV